MVVWMDRRSDSVAAQRTGKQRLLGGSDLHLQPGGGDAAQVGCRHRATYQRVGDKRPPLYLEKPSTHVPGFRSSQGHNFAAKAAFFFQECAILFYFFNFLFHIGV